MLGKIKFYNEDKGYGIIYTDERNEYFFHLSKIKNKPEQIDKDDIVEFEGFSTIKGLNAKNIVFFNNTISIKNDRIKTRNIISHKLVIEIIDTHEYEVCHKCYGSRECTSCTNVNNCKECYGSGKCTSCNGKGEIPSEKKNFVSYKYYISIELMHNMNKKIYLGSWKKEFEKKNNEIYFEACRYDDILYKQGL